MNALGYAVAIGTLEIARIFSRIPEMDNDDGVTVQLRQHGRCSIAFAVAGEEERRNVYVMTNDALAILARECEPGEFAAFVPLFLQKRSVRVRGRDILSAASSFERSSTTNPSGLSN